jgi:hypothetical protein
VTTQFSVKQLKEYLFIRSIGIINNLDEWLENDKRIFDLIVKHKVKKLVLDSQEVTYPESVISTYQMVDSYFANYPIEARTWFIAVIIKNKYKKLGEFWETACKNRGFMYRVFYNLEDATEWVKNP